MSDLSSMYSMMLEATNPATWEKNYQRQKMGEMELTEKQRAMEDEQRLRQIYSSGRQPSMQELMSINPRFGLEQQKANYELMKEGAGIQKTQAEIAKLGSEEHAKKAQIFANALGPVVENYMSSGQQNPYQFKQIIGSTLAQIENIHGIKPDVPFEDFTPEQILQSAESFNYPSQRMNTQMEMKKRMLPPAMTAEQQYGRVEMGPYGAKVQPPLPNAPMPSGGYRPGYSESVQQQYGQPESNIPAQDIDAFRAYKDSLPANSKERQAAEKALADAIKKNLPGSRFVTPEQEMDLRTKEAGEKKAVELEVSRKDANKQAINAYFRLRPPQQISKLIRESIQGGGAKKINELANLIGVSIPGATPTSALEVIAQQMVASKPFPPGSQSEKELEARMKSIGDPSSEVPAEQRLAKFDEWLREQEGLIAQEAELTPEELIDRVSEGYISKETAAKVYKRMHGGK